MPEGCVTKLLACDKQYRGELKTLLKEYREVLPTELPKRVPSDRGLGDEIDIKVVAGTEPSNRRYTGNL